MAVRLNRLRTPQFAARKRRALLIKGTLLAVLIAAVGGAFLYVAQRPEIMIQNVIVKGNEAVSEVELSESIQAQLGSRYLWILPKANSFIYPKAALTASALMSFKRLDSVEMRRIDLQTLEVSVRERKPVALWCGENRLGFGSTPTCYFVDKGGFIFTEAPQFTGDVYVRLYGALSSGMPIGERYLSGDYVSQLMNFIQGAAEASAILTEFAIIDDGEAEFYTSDGTRILISRDMPLDRTLDNLLSALTADDFKRLPLASYEYIDLRFGNKVYYRARPNSLEME